MKKLMYSEDNLLPLSGLSQLLWCERRCALIHIEGVWDDNRLTIEGKQLHEKVHSTDSETRGDIRTVCGLRLKSLRLGITGVADVVEFHRTDNKGRRKWTPFPVEYKRGKPKAKYCDDVQLCAQAMCLEEMLDVHIEKGALFYGKTRRRKEVVFAPRIREMTENAAVRLHKLFDAGITPKAEYSKRCDSCSLFSVCMPKSTDGKKSAERYLNKILDSEE